MKIAGKTLATRNTKQITLIRGDERYPIMVCALPPGWYDRMRALGVFNGRPKPKMVARQRQPGVVVRDTAGNVVYEEDHQDPDYKEQVAKYNGRIAALRLAEHLSMDGTIAFDSKRPEGNQAAEWVAYGDSLAAEIENPEGGFTAGEIEQILEVGDKLDSSIDLNAGIESFLPPA